MPVGGLHAIYFILPFVKKLAIDRSLRISIGADKEMCALPVAFKAICGNC